MDRIRIAFFDIDGTLVDFHAKQISAKTLEALTRLRAQVLFSASPPEDPL